MITKGAIFRAIYSVYDGIGLPTNPATATLSITMPDGSLVTPAPTITLPPAVTGVLLYDYPTMAVGLHRGLWSTTGPTTAKPFTFNVSDNVSGSILSLADAKDHLNIVDTDNDEEILTFLDVVTAIVEMRCGALLPRTYVERYNSAYRLMLRHGPVTEITAVEPWMPNFGETVALSDMLLDPVSWAIDRVSDRGFPFGPYRVTYKVARSVMPPNVLAGAKELLAHLWRTQRGPSTVGVEVGTLSGEEMFAVAGRSYAIPRLVMELLAPHEIGPMVG